MNTETAARLRQMRNKNNLSQEELAEKIGVSRQAVSKWERAEASPDTDNLILLSKLYGVTIDELLSAETRSEGVSLKKEKTVKEVIPENNSEEIYPNRESNSIPQGSPFGADMTAEEKKNSVKIGDELGKAGIAIGDALNAAGKKLNGTDWDGKLDKLVQGVEKGMVKLGSELEKGMDKLEDGLEKGAEKLSGETYKTHGKTKAPKPPATLLDKLFPLIITGLFFCTIPINLAHPGWTLFLLIPLYYTTKEAVRKREPLIFCYPVLCALFYFAIGGFLEMFSYHFADNWYGFMWLIFLTIPLYYTLIPAVRKKNPAIFCYPVLCVMVYLGIGLLLDAFWGYIGEVWLSVMWVPFGLTIPAYYIIIAHYRQKKKAQNV